MNLTDQYRARFLAAEGTAAQHASVATLLARAVDAGLDVLKTENLYSFDGAPGYSLGQGE